MKEKYTEAEWQMKKEAVLYPILVFWTDGFYGLEGEPKNYWRWCSHRGKIMISNKSNRQKRIKLEMVVKTGYDRMSNLRIKGPFFKENIQINANGQVYSKTMDLPPGKYFIEFKTDAKQVIARGDPRDLYFYVCNLTVKEE